MENSNSVTPAKSKKTWLITLIAVAIIAGAIGFVISHFLVSRPGDLGARAFPGGGPAGDGSDICDRINDGSLPAGPDGSENNDQSGKLQEYCADGEIDETERAELEASRPARQPGGRAIGN